VKYLKGLKGDTFFFLFFKIHQLVKFFFPKETYGSIWDQMHPNEEKFSNLMNVFGFMTNFSLVIEY